MSELFENRWVAAYCRSVDAFPVRRFEVDRAAVRTALQRLKQGRVVGIFPERGLRSGPESILGGAETGDGAASLARMAKVPLLPAVLLGSDQLYNPKVWRRFRSIRLFVGTAPPIAWDAAGSSKELAAMMRQSLRALAKEMQERFQILEEEMPATADRRKGREPA